AEHLSLEALACLLRQCWTKLRKGGTILIEAINPSCPAALADFHGDPTRLRPVHPRWLEFLLESERFHILEHISTTPVSAAEAPVAQSTTLDPAKALHYRTYAIRACK